MHPAQVSRFRDHYRQHHISRRYNGHLHFLSTVGICIAVIAYSVADLSAVSTWEWLAIPVTFLYANLVEYFGHRGPMHHPVRWLKVIHRRHAEQHHHFFTAAAMEYQASADYKAVLFPLVLIVFYLFGFALPVALLLTLVFSQNVALLFVATAVAYFLNYELLHLAYHTPGRSWVARLPGIRTLCRLHTLHHDPELMQNYNFNITYPIGDLLFGTLYRPAKSGVKTGRVG